MPYKPDFIPNLDGMHRHQDLFQKYVGQTMAKCVAAIDFGSSGTGFAYAFPPSRGELDPKSDIFTNGQWPDGTTGKTKTALLLDEENRFVAFGRSAQIKYKALGLWNTGKLFQFFKMDLYSQKLEGELEIKATDGRLLSAKIVFVESLKYIRDVLLKQLGRSNNSIASNEIKWVITIPAIWSDAAKQLMSEAAKMAGLSTKGGHDLLLALEPEAASLWCLKSGDVSLNDGDQYMVVDAGGGTIDITIHEKIITQAGDTVKETAPATGGDWGSNAIDRRIFKLLEDIFGRNRFEAIQRDVNGYTKLQDDIEASKCSFDGVTDVVLVLPDALTAVIDVEQDLTADAAVNAYGEATATEFIIRGPNFSIPASYFRQSLMSPSIKTTAQHVYSILKKYNQISRIILVGNFANCSMLQSEIQNIASNFDIKITVPSSPGEAVMKGAVLFGANPNIVASRASRFTYGVSLTKPFNPKHHPAEKKVIAKDGRAYCIGLFDVFVQAGQNFGVGHVVERTYQALEKDQKEIMFRIYASPRSDPIFIDDFKVKEIGKVVISVSDPHEPVSFIMMFSTQIHVKAVNESGEEKVVVIDFTN